MWLYVISLSCFVTLIVSFIGAKWEKSQSKPRTHRELSEEDMAPVWVRVLLGIVFVILYLLLLSWLGVFDLFS